MCAHGFWDLGDTGTQFGVGDKIDSKYMKNEKCKGKSENVKI